MRRRRRHGHGDPHDVAGRLRALEARPVPPRSTIVPVMSQDETEDDRYGIVQDTRPKIGMGMFPENPYDGQHFWLHEMDTREMYLFIWCHMYGKWISPTYYQAHQNGTFTETGTSFAARANGEHSRITIPYGKQLWDVGVSFEVTASMRCANSATNVSYARIGWYDWQENDATIGSVARASSEFSVGSGAGVFDMRVLPWEQFTDDPDPVGTHFTFVLETRVSAATGTWTDTQFTIRLVHEPMEME